VLAHACHASLLLMHSVHVKVSWNSAHFPLCGLCATTVFKCISHRFYHLSRIRARSSFREAHHSSNKLTFPHAWLFTRTTTGSEPQRDRHLSRCYNTARRFRGAWLYVAVIRSARNVTVVHNGFVAPLSPARNDVSAEQLSAVRLP
jgi:hypothetical protein